MTLSEREFEVLWWNQLLTAPTAWTWQILRQCERSISCTLQCFTIYFKVKPQLITRLRSSVIWTSWTQWWSDHNRMPSEIVLSWQLKKQTLKTYDDKRRLVSRSEAYFAKPRKQKKKCARTRLLARCDPAAFCAARFLISYFPLINLKTLKVIWICKVYLPLLRFDRSCDSAVEVCVACCSLGVSDVCVMWPFALLINIIFPPDLFRRSLTGDDGSTCIPITASNVVIVASRDSSIDSKARGSNKVC